MSDGFVARAARDTVPPRIDAWVTPPAYTGKPPIFLTADANQAAPTFTVPQGSDVSLRVTGGSGEETLAYADKDGNARAIDPAGPPAAKPVANTAAPKVRQFTGKLTSDGTLTLKSGEDDLGHWAFAVIPDKPPTILSSANPSVPSTAPSSSATRSTTTMAPPPPRRFSCPPTRSRRTRIRSMARPICRWCCRAAVARAMPPRPART
ncbi:hypothetical protein AJ88_44335 [Mesorhizobium amorphae CCBAU 01583]|nr:hypothetical protein AJ88_44335 [Mesorhizobium amorphae CCBAU 01583]